MLPLTQYIRDVPDFPKAGILFRDITPLLSAPQAFKQSILQLQAFFANAQVEVVVGVEARGFVFAPMIALALDASFVPARKPGRLPYHTVQASYTLEYGSNRLEIHQDAIAKGQRTILIDDLLATGGTMGAGIALVEKLGGVVVGCATLIELCALEGRKQLKGCPFHTLIQYP